MKIICYGDSNTYGYDPRSFVGGKYERVWTDILAEKTAHAVMGLGLNGRQIPFRARPLAQMHETVEAASQGHADLLVIMLGSNDIELSLNVMVVRARMASLLKEVKRWNIADKILLVGPPVNTSTRNLEKACREMNDSFEKLAKEEGIHYADASAWPLEMAHDHCHLTVADQDVFADEMAKVIAAL